MKGVLATSAAALAVGLGAGVVLAQQTPAPPRPYYVGNMLGQPIAPPAPDAANPPAFVAMSAHVKVYGAIVSTESCSYDPVRGLIVAPARGVGQAIRTNDAFVALINHDGSVHTPRWIGVQNPPAAPSPSTATAQRDNMTPPLVLNEPLGSDIHNGILYMADRIGGVPDPAANPPANTPQRAAIAMFDMATGAPAGRWEFPEIPAFNDIEVASDGTIFASISGAAGMIYKITADGVASIFVPTGAAAGDPPNSPNGIAFDPAGNVVSVGGGTTVFTWDRNTGALLNTENASQAGNDGLVIMPDGTKFISSVANGGVSMIRPGQPSELIAVGIPSAASMCYDSGANQLVIPMNANNGLAFVPLAGVWTP